MFYFILKHLEIKTSNPVTKRIFEGELYAYLTIRFNQIYGSLFVKAGSFLFVLHDYNEGTIPIPIYTGSNTFLTPKVYVLKFISEPKEKH